jgi:hypothetical protein
LTARLNLASSDVLPSIPVRTAQINQGGDNGLRKREAQNEQRRNEQIKGSKGLNIFTFLSRGQGQTAIKILRNINFGTKSDFVFPTVISFIFYSDYQATCNK